VSPSGVPPQGLSVRLGAAPADTTLHTGVPTHLDEPLRGWLREFLSPELGQRIAARLRIALHRTERRDPPDPAPPNR